jgi:hypothetical protein
MNKIFKIILSTVLIGTLFACQNESVDNEINTELLNLKNLKIDSRFISYSDKNQNLINNIKDINTITSLTEKENLTEQELHQLSLAFGFKSFEKYEEYYESQKAILLELENDYNLSSYNSVDIENVLIMDDVPSAAKSGNCHSYCSRTHTNCVGAVISAATLSHVGCLSADITVVAGIVCHGAVAALQYFAHDECNNQSEQCHENCN